MSTASSVVVITEQFDPHADAIIPLLQQRDVPVFRINTNSFSQDYRVAMTKGGITVEDARNGVLHFPSGARSVWYRKPVTPIGPEADFEARRFNSGETQESLHYFEGNRTDALPWVSHPADIRLAARKFPQQILAGELGLEVPRSIITNDPERAGAFIASCGDGVICKPLKEVGYDDDSGQRWQVFTRKLTVDEFSAAKDAVRACPTYFQEYVPKRVELRVTIIGREVFCCELDSQANPETQIDWRMGDVEKMKHAMVSLPTRVSNALVAMLEHYHLRFGTLDLVVTPDDRYVFLELNPNGQWYWIELLTGAPMAAAMTALLANPNS